MPSLASLIGKGDGDVTGLKLLNYCLRRLCLGGYQNINQTWKHLFKKNIFQCESLCQQMTLFRLKIKGVFVQLLSPILAGRVAK